MYYRQCHRGQDRILAYDTTTSEWSLTPHCPVYSEFTLAVINGTLITVGGYGEDEKDTNKLFSLIGAGEDRKKTWIEDFPPMPTKCCGVSALCVGAALIVVGGMKGDVYLKTVEILNISTRQWHTATELPKPLRTSSMTVCDDRIYLLGGSGEGNKWTKSVYSCSLSTLLTRQRICVARALSRSSANDTWIRVADLPVTQPTAVSFYDQLIAVGGRDSYDRPVPDIQLYDSSTNTWEVVSHMAIPRIGCFAAVLPDNQLMVVGGRDGNNERIDSVEFGRIE